MQEKIANLEIKIFYDSAITKKKERKGRELSQRQGERSPQDAADSPTRPRGQQQRQRTGRWPPPPSAPGGPVGAARLGSWNFPRGSPDQASTHPCPPGRSASSRSPSHSGKFASARPLGSRRVPVTRLGAHEEAHGPSAPPNPAVLLGPVHPELGVYRDQVGAGGRGTQCRWSPLEGSPRVWEGEPTATRALSSFCKLGQTPLPAGCPARPSGCSARRPAGQGLCPHPPGPPRPQQPHSQQRTRVSQAFPSRPVAEGRRPPTTFLWRHTPAPDSGQCRRSRGPPPGGGRHHIPLRFT